MGCYSALRRLDPREFPDCKYLDVYYFCLATILVKFIPQLFLSMSQKMKNKKAS